MTLAPPVCLAPPFLTGLSGFLEATSYGAAGQRTGHVLPAPLVVAFKLLAKAPFTESGLLT